MSVATGSPDVDPVPRRRRSHPCLPQLAIFGVAFVLAVVVIVDGHAPLLGVVYAFTSLSFVLVFARSVRAGPPRSRPEATARLTAAFDAVGCEETLAVAVQSQTATPCVLVHRKSGPIVVAAIDFVEHGDDEVLRGVAALQLAALRDPGLAKGVVNARRLQLVLIAIVSAASASTAPGATGLLASGASIGFSLWLFAAGGAALSRTGAWARRLARRDVAAYRLATDPAGVPKALRAMHAWRAETRAARSRSAVAVDRCLRPLPLDMHELERAIALETST